MAEKKIPGSKSDSTNKEALYRITSVEKLRNGKRNAHVYVKGSDLPEVIDILSQEKGKK